MKRSLSLFAILMLSIPAFAADHYHCEAETDGGVDAKLFSQMDLTVDGSTITGQVLSDEGWLKLGTNERYLGLAANVKNNHVSMTFNQYYDMATLNFDLVDGETTGKLYQSIDCNGDYTGEISISCKKTQ